jgi:hypothetical protein
MDVFFLYVSEDKQCTYQFQVKQLVHSDMDSHRHCHILSQMHTDNI